MFDWDEGNIGKNLSHGVQDWEIEEACEDAQARVIDYQWVRGEWRSILQRGGDDAFRKKEIPKKVR
jgi:hypothetical protein